MTFPGRTHPEWGTLLAAARRLSSSAAESRAADEYASEYGLALLITAQSPTVTGDESSIMQLHAETWLSPSQRSPSQIRQSLANQLNRYRSFPGLPAPVRDGIDVLIGDVFDLDAD